MELLSTLKQPNVAFVFPGQGSQYVGMGRPLYEQSPAARAIFEQADEILGMPLTRLCFEGPEDELQDTINAQPAILTVSLAMLAALNERILGLGEIKPRYVAGHSLGEYSALVAAGVLSFEEGLRLVHERGRLMKKNGEELPGGMAAVIGLNETTLEEVCRQASSEGIVIPANENAPGQSVLSGEINALLRAMDLAKAAGARKVVRLGVSIASHSPLMQIAGAQFAEIIEHLHLRDPQIPIIANITGQAIHTAEELRRELAKQIERPVQWTRSVLEMINGGTTTFIEIGPNQVLSGLIKRINRDVQVYSAEQLLNAKS